MEAIFLRNTKRLLRIPPLSTFYGRTGRAGHKCGLCPFFFSDLPALYLRSIIFLNTTTISCDYLIELLAQNSMKRMLFYIIIAASLLLAAFFKSNTWQTYQEMEEKNGIDYCVTKHKINWDKFFSFLKDIPKNNRQFIVRKYLRRY